MLSLDLWVSSFVQELSEIDSPCCSPAPSQGRSQGGASLHSAYAVAQSFRAQTLSFGCSVPVSVPVVSIAFLSCWGEMKVSPTPRKL